jgi:CRISPR system Cascade subunit CasA
MNLATEPWIRVLRADGSQAPVSLEQAFAEGESIRDLSVRPHERIALMRLLVCVAQAGLEGPKDNEDWLRCKSRVGEAARRHLRDRHKSFELLGTGPRFGQVKGLIPGHESDSTEELVTKLNFALATGNNATIFDNGGASMDARRFPPDELASWLLAFQCFTPPGGSGYTGKCPCGDDNMLHTILQGRTLAESIWLNLLDRESLEEALGVGAWGQPVWTFPAGWQREDKWRRVATATYLGRLVPITKGFWLHENGDDMIAKMTLERKGLTHPSFRKYGFREPAATTFSDGSKRWLLKGSSSVAVWRDLPAIIAKQRSDKEGRAGCLALQRFGGSTPIDLWIGGLIVVNTANIENTLESVLHLPTGALSTDFQAFYDGGVKFAEAWEGALKDGIGAYRRRLGDSFDKPRSPKRERQRWARIRYKAVTHFWTRIESDARDVLVSLCVNPPDELKCAEPYYLDYSRHESRWGPLVRRAAEDAFALACPRASARQALAFGEARQKMWRSGPQPKRKIK